MKKSYLRPLIIEFEVIEKYNLLDPSVGDISPDDTLSKESDFEEEEAPVYQNNSIWADEEKEN